MVAAEVEGAPEFVVQPEAEEQDEAEWAASEELDGSEDALLLNAEVLPSNEDFPQNRQVGWWVVLAALGELVVLAACVWCCPVDLSSRARHFTA